MSFKSFLDNKDIFYIEGICVSIYEVPLSLNEDTTLLNFIKDKVSDLAYQIRDKLEEVPLKKYRVSLQYPRSSKGAKLGHYLPDNMYVYAASAKEAKKKVEGHVRNKLEPVENDETRRYPRNNYLKKLKRKHLGIQTKQVRTWDDFADSLKHISDRKGDLMPLDYLDEDDFKIIIKASKKKNFVDSLRQLSKKEQKLLKKFYFHMLQSPWTSQESKDSVGDLTQVMKMLDSKKLSHVQYGEKQPESDWPYWSIFEPKSKEETDRLMGDIQETKDVFDVANKFGISVKDLRLVKDDLFKSENEYIDELRILYKWVREHVKVSPKNKLFQSDYSNPEWARKYGVHWDELLQTLMGSEGAEVNFPFTDNENPDDTKQVSDAMDWLWDFYQKGMPKKVDGVDQWRMALQHILDYRDRVKEKNEVPF